MACCWLRLHPMCACAHACIRCVPVLTQTPLSHTGRDEDTAALHTPREVTIHTLSDYVSKVANLWLQDGVARQAAAFRAGIEDLCSSPEILLAPFTLPELQTMLCGTSTIAPWTEAELRSALQPAAPYTRESPTCALPLSAPDDH